MNLVRISLPYYSDFFCTKFQVILQHFFKFNKLYLFTLLTHQESLRGFYKFNRGYYRYPT